MNADDDSDLALANWYAEFLSARSSVPLCGPLAPYNWYRLPNPLSGEWMAYSQMLDEHARELANAINELSWLFRSLATWNGIIEGKSDDVKLDLVIEFIAPLTALALSLPYALRSKFIYSVAHLSHQANRRDLEWKDELPPDRRLNFKIARSRGRRWNNWDNFEQMLKRINDDEFRAKTKDFRNRFHHGYSPHIEIGIAGFVTRYLENGCVVYGLGGIGPLRLGDLVNALSEQHAASTDAFAAYQELVREQIASIEMAHEKRAAQQRSS